MMKYVLRLPFIARDAFWPPPPPPDPRETLYSQHAQYRALRNLSALVRDPVLEQVAQRRAELVRSDYLESGVLRHDNPNVDGDQYWQLLPQYGITHWAWAGEVLALNNFAEPVAEAMKGWENSPSHRRNLEGEWNRIGCGYTFISPIGIHILAVVYLDG